MLLQKRRFVFAFAFLLLFGNSFSADFAAYYTRLSYQDEISGKYADVAVRLGDMGELLFGREKGYLPYWKTGQGEWMVQEIVKRTGNGPSERPDEFNVASCVRIIENTPQSVVIHWRYMPDLENQGLTSIVHEVFTIAPDGLVKREIRRATDKAGKWKVTVQNLRLRPDGIEQVSLAPETVAAAPVKPSQGAPVKANTVGAPVAWWKFDEGTNPRDEATRESVSGRDCAISGDKTFWKKGVSGTALAFDGYHSGVSLPAAQAPSLKSGFTLEAWVVLAAYPWNFAPVAQQMTVGSDDLPGRGFIPGDGYSLAIDDSGHPALFLGAGGTTQTLVASEALPLFRWTHVAATYEPTEGRIVVYVDGKENGKLENPELKAGLKPADCDLSIGLHQKPVRATLPVRPKKNYPGIFGIEGMLDEVRIHDRALAPADVARSCAALDPGAESRAKPDLERPALPGEVDGKNAPRFGARYANLGYYELWNSLWREGDWPDVVVRFDQLPVSVLFWHGTSYGPSFVMENNKWRVDQSEEQGCKSGCGEHMSDKQCRYGHVRLIENTDARVVVHWRYPLIGPLYDFLEETAWTDEYFYIYPDGVTIRGVFYHGRGAKPGWDDHQLFTGPGQRPEDIVDLKAVTVGNLKGESARFDWTNGIPKNDKIKKANIQLIHFKSQYKSFCIGEEKAHWAGGWGETERSPAFGKVYFAGPWNHWPISQLPSDGRFALATDRVTHFAVGGIRQKKRLLYGFTECEDASRLVPLGRAWNMPPEAVEQKGCYVEAYDQFQAAFQIRAKKPSFSFRLEASEESPIVNPCFVVRRWGGDFRAALKTNGKPVPAGPDFRQGIVKDTDGKDMLVIWARIQEAKPVEFEIARAK